MTNSRAARLVPVALSLAAFAGCREAPHPAPAAEQTQREALAAKPPLGWNSWNCFGVSVTEAQVRENAAFMAERLKPHGYEYVVIDLGWYLPAEVGLSRFKEENPPQAIDEHGRLVPDPVKFPSSTGGLGLAPLAEYVHGLGLKLGLHVMRGIPRQAIAAGTTVEGTSIAAADVVEKASSCDWYDGMRGVDVDRPGGQEYYDSIARLYAAWGVDYIKADDMSHPYHAREIEALSTAIARAGRPIVLSLSPGATPPAEAEHVKAHAQMWRISPDFWDHWPLLERQFELCRLWQPHVGPGHWPDADMLPLGRLRLTGADHYAARVMGLSVDEITDESSRLTPAEQRTLLTLWSIFRSPLMMGGHLPATDESTLDLLTNDEVLAVDQSSTNNREVRAEGDRVIWAADEPGTGAVYAAFFNKGALKTRLVRLEMKDVGLPERVEVRDLWRRSDAGEFQGSIAAEVEPHGAVLVKMWPAEDQAHSTR